MATPPESLDEPSAMAAESITPATAPEPLEPSTPPLSEPDAPQNTPETNPVMPPQQGRSRLKLMVLIVLALVVLAGTAVGSYMLGKHKAKPAASPTPATASMTVPAGATIIEKCEPGLGTQYVLPKDIPGGPVYNVYQGKVIGIEYMTSITTVDKLDTMLENLPLYGQKYNHINIMSMPAHSGFPTPHYQVDVMMVSDATAKKITCGSSSMSSSSSSTMSTDSMNSSSTSKM